MDIIDVMLARALTPQGRIESYAAQSQQAVAQANQAVAAIDSITEQTQANNEAAQTAMQNAQTAMENAAAAEQRIDEALESVQAASEQQIESKIDELAFSLTSNANASAIVTDMVVSTPSGLAKTVANINKMYRTTGQNEDGTMTQKAITDALAEKANSADTVTKTYVDQKIAAIPTSGGNGISNLGIDAAGHLVVVGPDGTIKASSTTEAAIIQALIQSGVYTAEGTVGITIDYENKFFERTQDAASLAAGEQFNKYALYGGRLRCNVSDNGVINAFYGDANYTEDGSNGQVMVYQPKFYYKRILLKTDSTNTQNIIRKEMLILSSDPRDDFKLHPLFINAQKDELDYVLIPAYESSIYDTDQGTYILNDNVVIDTGADKLASIAGAKPITCRNHNLSINDMRALATNRGTGWQLTNMEFESALQMLCTVEFGTMNAQSALDKGIVDITGITNKNCSSLTGSTSMLGNTSGYATETINESDGTTITYTESGKRAISYRGMENPWGNTWRFIDNCQVKGNGVQKGGLIYLNDKLINYMIPNDGSWISAMGYADDEYDWLYLPGEFASTGNSAVPVGDSIWLINNLSGTRLAGAGGSYTSGYRAGAFFYGFDIIETGTPVTYNGRIMFIPEKNNIYNTNIVKWRQHYGG